MLLMQKCRNREVVVLITDSIPEVRVCQVGLSDIGVELQICSKLQETLLSLYRRQYRDLI
jgi:hypothetical protein